MEESERRNNEPRGCRLMDHYDTIFRRCHEYDAGRDPVIALGGTQRGACTGSSRKFEPGPMSSKIRPVPAESPIEAFSSRGRTVPAFLPGPGCAGGVESSENAVCGRLSRFSPVFSPGGGEPGWAQPATMDIPLQEIYRMKACSIPIRGIFPFTGDFHDGRNP